MLAAEGRMVLVEHIRDIPNFIAFTPGFMHFMSEKEWRRVATASDPFVTGSFRITPFVEVFALQRG
ncbi:MAG: hypothetical protein IH874_01585 [Candidatus Dadabacteria bacterium]|nr:hypothetical protein [Candidatus Dadabacteria bacterium]